MNIKQYFISENLFQINTAVVSPGEKVFFMAGVVLVLLAIVTKIAGKLAPTPVDSKYRGKFYSLFLTGIIPIQVASARHKPAVKVSIAQCNSDRSLNTVCAIPRLIGYLYRSLLFIPTILM